MVTSRPDQFLGNGGNLRPWFVLAAGPNGAGKSTLIASSAISKILGTPEDLKGFEVLNPDQIAAAHKLQHGQPGDLESGKEVLTRLRAAFAEGKPVILETVVAGMALRRMIADARALGYRVGVVFVYLRSADIHVARVAQRARSGGHSIPESTIRRRYDRSLASFEWLAQAADHAALVDNSEFSMQSGEPILVAIKAPLPEWRVYRLESVPPALAATLARLVSKH